MAKVNVVCVIAEDWDLLGFIMVLYSGILLSRQFKQTIMGFLGGLLLTFIPRRG